MIAKPILGSVLTVLMVVSPASGQEPRHSIVRGTPSCSSCTIQVQIVTNLAFEPERTAGLPAAVHRDQKGRYWVFRPPDPPAVFDRQGAFVRSVGRTGQGPGEFVAAVYGSALPGDSILIVDRALATATVVSPNFELGRRVQLPSPLRPAIPLKWPDDVVMNGIIGSPSSAGFPLHLLSLRESPAVLKRSFGPGSGELVPGSEFNLLQRLTPSRQGFWSADRTRYRLFLWGRDSRLIRTLERTPTWFRGPPSYGIGTPDSPPPLN